MRPTVFLLSTAAVAAAVIVTPTRGTAQDRGSRRGAETLIQSLDDGGVRVWRLGADSTRAALGVSLAPARGSSDTLGVRVVDVAENGPAAKAGIEEGDRIVSIDGTALRIDPADADDPMFRDLASRRLQRALDKHKPGDEVTLGLQRGRESRTVRVKTVAASQLDADRSYGYGFATAPRALMRSFDSARVRSEDRAALGLTVGITGSRRDTLGLFVSSVAPDGPAEKAGIIEGARVAGIDGVDLRVSRDDADDPELAGIRARRFTRELEKKKAGDDVSLRVWQNGALRTVTVRAARSEDVWKNRRGFAFSFGDGDGTFVMPPMAPMAPMAPLMPSAPMLRFETPGVRVMPRVWMSAPMPPATTPVAPRAALRAAALAAPRFRTIAPRAVRAPRAREIVRM